MRTDLVTAAYRTAELPEHRGNPLIEAIPPFRSADELVPVFGRYPAFAKSERNLSKPSRMMAISRLDKYFEPSPSHYEVVEQIGLLIHGGYASRNAADPQYQKALVEFYRQNMTGEKIRPIEISGPSTASSFSLFGVSGAGKSTVVDRTLSFFPQALSHPKYGFVQLVWLKLDCPMDGSLKQLLLGMIAKIDAIFGTKQAEVVGRRATVDELIIFVAKIAAFHNLGLLVVDEIQNLLDAPGVGRAKMLNFFVTLSNDVKIPFVVMGTPKAQKLLANVFREARRLSASITWDRMKPGNEWDYFLKQLWRFQWIAEPVKFNQELSDVMYFETQGIRALVVKLFQLCQLQAMRSKNEILTVELIRKVAQERFLLLRPALDALRRGKKTEILKYEDLLFDGLSELQTQVDLGTRGAAFHDHEVDEKDIRNNRMRMISNLMRSGCDQTLAVAVTDATFTHPRITDEIRNRILAAVQRDEADCLIEAFQNQKAKGPDSINAFAKAGFVDDIKK